MYQIGNVKILKKDIIGCIINKMSMLTFKKISMRVYRRETDENYIVTIKGFLGYF